MEYYIYPHIRPLDLEEESFVITNILSSEEKETVSGLFNLYNQVAAENDDSNIAMKEVFKLLTEEPVFNQRVCWSLMVKINQDEYCNGTYVDD